MHKQGGEPSRMRREKAVKMNDAAAPGYRDRFKLVFRPGQQSFFPRLGDGPQCILTQAPPYKDTLSGSDLILVARGSPTKAVSNPAKGWDILDPCPGPFAAFLLTVTQGGQLSCKPPSSETLEWPGPAAGVESLNASSVLIS